MAIWNWSIENKALYSLFNKVSEKTSSFDFKEKQDYKIKPADFIKSFYRLNECDFLLESKNQSFLFYSVFSDFLVDKNHDFIVSQCCVEYNDEISKDRVSKLIKKGVDYVFESLGTHSNSSFYTSSKNTIYYKNKLEVKSGFSALSLSNNVMYLASVNAAEIPLVKAFTSRIGKINVLDFLVSEEKESEIFVILFKDVFGLDFYKNLKDKYKGFIRGDYNSSEVTGIEKQILIPDSDCEGGYVSLSPMSNHNIGFFVNPLLYEKGKLLNAGMRLVGGSQPQNTSYTNSLLGGNMINFKMSFPQSQKSEISYLIFNINKRNGLFIDLGKELTKLEILLNNKDIPNKTKDKMIDNFVNLFSNEFFNAITITLNCKNEIKNKVFLNFINGDLNFNETKNYISILVENSIYPKKHKKSLTKELRNKLVSRIYKIYGEIDE